MGLQVVKTKIWTPGADSSIKEQGQPTVQFSHCRSPWTWHIVVQKAFEKSHWPSFIKWRLLSEIVEIVHHMNYVRVNTAERVNFALNQYRQKRPNAWIWTWTHFDEGGPVFPVQTLLKHGSFVMRAVKQIWIPKRGLQTIIETRSRICWFVLMQTLSLFFMHSSMKEWFTQN